MNPTAVSVVIPAYNEGSRIRPNLEKVAGYLSARFSRFEVIVVDDGSTDDTREKVAEIASRDCRIILLPYPANRGKGFAVRQGMLKAEGDAVIFTDADLSTPVEEIEKALEGLSQGYPVVIASRQHPDSILSVQQGWLRERTGMGFNLVVRTLLSLPHKDTQCGFKCLSQKAAREIFSLARLDGFAFDVEVLLIARRLGYPVKEIPISWANSPESKVRVIRHALPVVRDLLAIYYNDRRGFYRR